MLVVDRERLGGVLREGRRASRRVENLPPAAGRARVLPCAAQRKRQCPQPVEPDVIAVAEGIAHAALDGQIERRSGAVVPPRARVDAAERERFARVARLPGPDAGQMQQA